MSTIIEKLEQHQPATLSRWREKAEFRRAHKKLLRTLCNVSKCRYWMKWNEKGERVHLLLLYKVTTYF